MRELPQCQIKTHYTKNTPPTSKFSTSPKNSGGVGVRGGKEQSELGTGDTGLNTKEKFSARDDILKFLRV